MITQLLLFFLLVAFSFGCTAIVLFQLNILWKNISGFVSKKGNENVISTIPQLMLKVIDRHELSERHFSVCLQSVNGDTLVNFFPGQYLTLLTPSQTSKAGISNIINKRCYSLASWHKDVSSYELGIQVETDGEVSTWLHRHLQIGTVINALPPKGDFIIKAKKTLHTVLIAGGIGITPLRAMVHKFIADFNDELNAESLGDLSSRKHMTLFYSAKSLAQMCYLNEFIQLEDECIAFSFHPFFSSHQSDVLQSKNTTKNLIATIGRLNVGHIKEALEFDIKNHHYYLCGPNGMIDNIKMDLLEHAIPIENIHFERFGISNTSLTEEKFSVRLGKNKNIAFHKQRTLLDAIQKEGVEIPSECRTGECGQCKVKLCRGEVKQLIETDVYLNANEILPCCCIPVSDLLIEV